MGVNPEDKLDQELESQESFGSESREGALEKLEVASDCKDFKSEVSSVVPENSAPEIQKVLPEAQNVAPEQKLSGASQAKESSPENLNPETVSDHQKSIWDKAAEIDIPSEVHLSFEEEESEDLTSSPTQQKITDQPISKVGANSSKLSKAETDFQIEKPPEKKKKKKKK